MRSFSILRRLFLFARHPAPLREEMPEQGSIQQVKSRIDDEVLRNEELIDNNVRS